MAMRLHEISEVGRPAVGDALADGRGSASSAPDTGRSTSMSRALTRLRVRGITVVMRATLFWDDKCKSVRTAELVA